MDLWTKKPETIEQLAGNAIVKKQFTNYFTEGTLPHALLIVGASGTGKGCLCNIIKNYLKVNDVTYTMLDVGVLSTIDASREVVRNLSQCPIGGGNTMYQLDEVHRLSKNSQQTWLASLEALPSYTYVVATTDQPNLLLPSFRSRFQVVVLQQLTKTQMMDELLHPYVAEGNIKIKKSTAELIYDKAKGNNRAALTILQTLSSIDPDKHLEVLNSIKNDEEDTPVYKAINILYTTAFSTTLQDYCMVANVFTNTGMDAEAIRIVLMRDAEMKMKSPSSSNVLQRAYVLIGIFSDMELYGEGAFGTLLAGLYNFIQQFSVKI